MMYPRCTTTTQRIERKVNFMNEDETPAKSLRKLRPDTMTTRHSSSNEDLEAVDDIT
jgi:hypothetical protein